MSPSEPSYPIDGAVLMGGCDKTTPGLIMGATSMNVPSVFFPAGPMLRGNWGGVTLGSGSDTWKYWEDLKPSDLLSMTAFRNAITTVLAIGGSTNAIIYAGGLLIAVIASSRSNKRNTASRTVATVPAAPRRSCATSTRRERSFRARSPMTSESAAHYDG